MAKVKPKRIKRIKEADSREAIKQAKIVFEAEKYKGKAVALYLSHDVIEAVVRLSRWRGVSKSGVVTHIIRKYLQEKS